MKPENISEESFEHMMMHNEMLISDAASMYRRPVSKTMKPYDYETLIFNNKAVDDWSNSVLTKLGKNGKIKPLYVNHSWEIFKLGLDFKLWEQHDSFVPVLSDEVFTKWWELFSEKSVAELLPTYGLTYLTSMWSCVLWTIRVTVSRMQYEEIYKGTTQAMTWNTLANEKHKLFKGEVLPFNLSKEIVENVAIKINAITSSIPIIKIDLDDKPILKRDIESSLKQSLKNVSPSEKEARTYFNTCVRKFCELLGGIDTTPFNKKEVFTKWNAFFEGHEVRGEDYFQDVLRFDESVVKHWLDLFATEDFKEIVPHGVVFISLGHEIIKNTIRTEMITKKYEMFFKNKKFDEIISADIESVVNLEKPYGISQEMFNDVREIATTIMRHKPCPKV